eukprot:9079557-Alexandrium_andersonii.AAC.1
MSASLVGSEMCIRDRRPLAASYQRRWRIPTSPDPAGDQGAARAGYDLACLLYTSDAADDM